MLIASSVVPPYAAHHEHVLTVLPLDYLASYDALPSLKLEERW